jgi:hypothetical protein
MPAQAMALAQGVCAVTDNKPNCYECKWRGEVPGSCHSSCHHPAFAAAHDDPLGALFGLLGKRGPLAQSQITADECKVEGHLHGIRSGWFVHPYNFDPVWLKSCTGFQARGVTTHEV